MSAPRESRNLAECLRLRDYPPELVKLWREAECAVLGSILLDNAALDAARGTIKASDWYFDPRHATIWESVCALADGGRVIDVLTLSAHLRARERLHAIGGSQYLGELTDTIPTIAHIASHARLVAEAHQIRCGVDAASTAAAYGLGGDLVRLRSALAVGAEATADRGAEDTVASLGEIVEKQFERMAAHREGGAPVVQGLPYPLPTLNRWTRGMHPGQLIIVAARPAEGKSALLDGIAVHAASARPDGRAHALFSLEMEHAEYGERALAYDAEVDIDVIRGATVATDEDMRRLTASLNRLHGLPVYVDDASRHTPASIRARCVELKKRQGLAAIYIDYLQLTEADTAPDGRKPDTRAEEVGRVTRALKRMAKDLEVPVVVAAQINRESEKGGKSQRPRLAQLRESGDVEQDANVVILLHRTSEKANEAAMEITREVTVILEKNRGGRAGDVPTLFRGAYQRFYEVAPDPEGAPRDARGGGEDFSEYEPGPKKRYGRAYDGAKGATEAPFEEDVDPTNGGLEVAF